jgi:rhodanese-related sulfurtransferase
VEAEFRRAEDAEVVLVVCGDGARSREVASELAGRDVEVAFLDGGMKAWSRGQPLQPPPAEAEFEGPKKKTLY